MGGEIEPSILEIVIDVLPEFDLMGYAQFDVKHFAMHRRNFIVEIARMHQWRC